MKSFISKDANDGLFGPIVNFLDQNLTPDERTSVKIATSDKKGGDARAIVVYTDSGMIPPLPFANWTTKTFNDGTSYDQMYEDLMNFLNFTGGLTPTQKYHSKIAMTNIAGGASTLTIIYPIR